MGRSQRRLRSRFSGRGGVGQRKRVAAQLGKMMKMMSLPSLVPAAAETSSYLELTILFMFGKKDSVANTVYTLILHLPSSPGVVS